MTSNEVKQLLRQKGIDTKFISVSTKRGNYNVEIKSPAIKIDEVESALKHLESIDRCEATGEILSGGNTFVFVSYKWEVGELIKENEKSVIMEEIKKWVCPKTWSDCIAIGYHIQKKLKTYTGSMTIATMLNDIMG